MRRILLVLSLAAMLGVATAAPVVANDLEPEDVLRVVSEDGSFLVSGGAVADFLEDAFGDENVDGVLFASDSDVDNSLDVNDLEAEDGTLLVGSGDLDELFDDNDPNGVLVIGSDFDNDFDFVGGGPAALEFEQEDVQSGNVEPVVDISNAGDNANLAPTALQSANSGNVQNEQGAVLSGSEVDDVEFEGSSIEVASEFESDTTQTIEQSTAASR